MKKKSNHTQAAPGARTPKSSARVVLTNREGKKVASAPILELAPVRFHIRRILVPIDFSPNSHEALRYARHFAEQFGSTICLIHVIEPILIGNDLAYTPAPSADLEEQRMESARNELKTMSKELGAGVPVESKVRLGRAWKEITDEARTLPVDLLIVSTHGYTGFKYALMGSVAEKIVRHAPCPVLVVRPGEHEML